MALRKSPLSTWLTIVAPGVLVAVGALFLQGEDSAVSYTTVRPQQRSFTRLIDGVGNVSALEGDEDVIVDSAEIQRDLADDLI